MQRDVTKEYIIPFINSSLGITLKRTNVLEVGCGEAGVLQAFLEQGANHCVGIELSAGRVELANTFLSKEYSNDRFSIYCQNIHDPSIRLHYKDSFDIIVLKDVIEHIHDRPEMMMTLKSLLKRNGAIFMAFPPWQMPFGGHQQNSTSRFVKKAPWIHLLPLDAYLALVKQFDHRPGFIEGLKEIRDTRLPIGEYESLVKESGYREIARQDYLINPIYYYKFGFKPRRQANWISQTNGLRNLVTTCVYSMIVPDN